MDDAKAGMKATMGGEYDKATPLLTKAIDSSELSEKSLGIAYNFRGIAWDRKGNYDKAIADYTKAIEIKPKNGTGWYNRARIYCARGEEDKALSDLKRAVTLDGFNKYWARSMDVKDLKNLWYNEKFKKLIK
jgi:tetratricopeptide (TPR) repeat protein